MLSIGKSPPGAGELLRPDNGLCTLTKKARKRTAAQYRQNRIHSVYAEPGGGCAMTSVFRESDQHRAVMQAWQLAGEEA